MIGLLLGLEFLRKDLPEQLPLLIRPRRCPPPTTRGASLSLFQSSFRLPPLPSLYAFVTRGNLDRALQGIIMPYRVSDIY